MTAVMIGVDPHKGSHTAVVISAAEEPLGEIRVRASAAQAGKLTGRAAAWPERTRAVEGAAGLGRLLAQQLAAAGERVLDVQPKLASRVRLPQAGDTNKNDPNDARSVAVAALRSRTCRQVAAEDHPAVLKVRAERHRDLARLRNQVACRLHAVLCDLVPGGIAKEISAAQAARILGQVTPSSAAALARTELAAEFLQDMRHLDAQLRDTRKKLAAAVKASGTTLTDVFGVGPVIAGTIIGDIAGVSRFPSRDHFTACNGTAPVEVSSGQHRCSILSVRCSVFGIDRTPNSWHAIYVDAEILLADAFAQLGVQARQALGASDQRIEMVIEPGGTRIQVKRRALVTDEAARRLLTETPSPSDSLLLVVGDRITETARRLLIEHHAGYYDLRGHLALRSSNVVIDADVKPVSGRAERTHGLSGSAGLEVATTLLMEPTAGVAVREMARRLGRSASTISEVLAALRGAGLVDDRHRVEGAELFWQVADRWPATRLHLAQAPRAGDNATATPLQLGLQDPENTTGWALTDSAAAVAYGAPLAVRTDQLLDFYVPNQAILRRATTLLGTASSRSQARCAIRVAPVPAACSHRADVATKPFEWPLTHPVFVALDLAQDAGRGREILEAWSPPEGWTRVW